MEDRESYQTQRLIKSVKEETDKNRLIEIVQRNMSVLIGNAKLARSLVAVNEHIKPIIEEFAISLYPEEEIDEWITVNGMKSAIEEFGYENIPMKAIYSEEESKYIDYREEVLGVASEYLDQGEYDIAEQIYKSIVNKKDMIARFQGRYGEDGNISQDELEKSTIYRAKCGLTEIELRRKTDNGEELSEEELSEARITVMEGYNTFGLKLTEIQTEALKGQLLVYEHRKSKEKGESKAGGESKDYVEELRPSKRLATFEEKFTIEKVFANPDKTGWVLFILGGEDEGVAVLETYYIKAKDKENGEETIQETKNVATKVLPVNALKYMTNISEIGEEIDIEGIAKAIGEMSPQELIQRLNEMKKTVIEPVQHRGRGKNGEDQGSEKYFIRLRKKIDKVKERLSENIEIQEKSEPTEDTFEELAQEEMEQTSEEQETVDRKDEKEETLDTQDEHQEESSSTQEEHSEESFDMLSQVLEQMKTCDAEYERMVEIKRQTDQQIAELNERRKKVQEEINGKIKSTMTDTLKEEIKNLLQERNRIMKSFQDCLKIKTNIQEAETENRRYRDSLNSQFEMEFNRGEANEG